jgi:hypothetical protein
MRSRIHLASLAIVSFISLAFGKDYDIVSAPDINGFLAKGKSAIQALQDFNFEL